MLGLSVPGPVKTFSAVIYVLQLSPWLRGGSSLALAVSHSTIMAHKPYTYLRLLFQQPSTQPPLSPFSLAGPTTNLCQQAPPPLACAFSRPTTQTSTNSREKPTPSASLRELHMGRRLNQLASLTSTTPPQFNAL